MNSKKNQDWADKFSDKMEQFADKLTDWADNFADKMEKRSASSSSMSKGSSVSTIVQDGLKITVVSKNNKTTITVDGKKVWTN